MTTELLFRDDAYLQNASARVLALHERGIELDRTIFYPQGGGQSGDTGALLRASGERIAIANTCKGDAIDSVLHVPAPAMARPEIGEALTLEIDWERRYSLMRLHTALHSRYRFATLWRYAREEHRRDRPHPRTQDSK